MNIDMNQRPVDVLLVVDEFDDVRRIRRTLQQAKVRNRVHHVGEAAEATAYLRQEVPYTRAPSPGLILLDASLPRKSGIDLLTELKSDPKLAGIPVIILVRSESEYRLFENCMYAADGVIQKPIGLIVLIQALASIDTLSVVLVQSTPAK